MKRISRRALAQILNGNPDFVLELYVLTEPKLCFKPVYKFIGASAGDEAFPEFCLIYCEADDPEEITASVNLKNPDKNININFLPGREIRKIISHGGYNSPENGEFCVSYYHNGKNYSPLREFSSARPEIRPLAPADENLSGILTSEDFYFDALFRDFIKQKIYRDCGIFAAFDSHGEFTGYLAYYGIAENIRDVSYIYVAEKHRGKHHGKALLEYFAAKNAAENKISYYSYADGAVSRNLAESCGFLPCARRLEY